MNEVIIDNVKFKNVPDKRYGTKIGDLLTQSNVGMSQTVAEYMQSDAFYTLVNSVDIDWNSIEVEDGLVLDTTADLINWIISIINKIPSVKIISVIFSTETSFPTSEEIQQLLDMPAHDFAQHGSKYQYYFYLKKEQKYYFIPAAYSKDNTNVISIRGIDDIAVLSFNESYGMGVLSFSENQAPDLSDYYTKEEVNTLLDGKIDTTMKGAKNGVASLDSTGKVPASQLPSYVDDVLEGYLDDSPSVESFSELNSYIAGDIVLYLGTIYRFKVNHAPGIFTPGEMQKIENFPIEGEVGKIYSDIFTSKTYRWSGSIYVPIKGDLVIGTTQGTAFDGAAGAALQTQVMGMATQVEGKVDKIAGKDLSTNDYTDEDKAKVAAAITEHQDISGKVDKVVGKGLSTNDYTNAEKQKVADAIVAADIAGKANTSDVYTKSETYSKTELDNLITTPNQQYVSVTATAQTTAVTDLLPATGAADTIYRVGNWDGTQYNDSVYSEYAWNGSAYLKLCTKSQVGEVYDISANHADTKYADLTAALGTGGANIPESLRKGGMSVKFVQSSDNKYVQYFLTKDEWSASEADWEKMNLEEEVSQLDRKVGKLDAEVFGGIFTPELTWSDGYIRRYGGQIASSTASKFTQPFILKKGQKVTIGTANANIGIICTTEADSLAIGDTVTVLQATSTDEFETYTYVAEQDIKIVLCVKWSDYSISFSVDNCLKKRVEGLEMNDESSEVEFKGLENEVNNLKAEVDGGNRFYANKSFDINNQFINYEILYVELEEPLSDFYYKFITPEDVAITVFGVKVWDEEGNVYTYTASVSPNEEGHFFSSLSYKVKKFAISNVAPDVRYTGTFKIQIYKKIVLDCLNLQVNGGDVVIGKKIVEVDNEFVNSNNTACSLLAPVRTFRMKLSIPKGLSITQYSVYLYDSDNTSHIFGNFIPGIEQIVTDKGYDIVKVAVAAVTPDERYTGTFVFEVVKHYESPLARKEDVATQIAEINSKMNYDDRETIPAYYFANNYLSNKVAFIRNLLEGCSANGDVFIFQTDEHWELNAQHSPALIKYIADNLNICRLFDGGDFTHAISSNGHTSNWVMDFEKLRKKTFNGRLYHIVGNHEYLTEMYSDLDLYDDADFYDWVDYCYFNNQDIDSIVYGDSEKHYYYVDNKQRKIRYIILSSFKQKITPIENVGSTYTRVAENDMDATQLNWFTNTALNVEQGWTIIVFSHFFCSVNRDGRTDDGYMLNVSPYIWGPAIPFAKAMLNYNGNGTIAAVIQGHMHWDAAFTINDNIAGNPTPTGRQIPCIATACDAYNFDGMPSEKLFNRTINTITEQAFDVVVLNKTARKLTFVRIGAPAYNLLVPDTTGNYPMFGNLEYREFSY